jgi:hypothetical protein
LVVVPAWLSAEKEDGIERYINRTALLMVLSVCCLLLAAMAIPIVFQRTEELLPRLAAALPIPIGLALAAVVRAMHAKLRAARGK